MTIISFSSSVVHLIKKSLGISLLCSIVCYNDLVCNRSTFFYLLGLIFMIHLAGINATRFSCGTSMVQFRSLLKLSNMPL